MNTSSAAWLSDSMMNLLVDYYTEVQYRPYGSGVTRENVLPVLRELDLGYLCVYAKGHSGYTTWKSSLHTAHTMLAQDMPRFFREVTRETGTRLVLYYSGLLDGIAGLRHPEWRMLHVDGSEQRFFSDFANITAYANCPHSAYFDEWVAIHLRELLAGMIPMASGSMGIGRPPATVHAARPGFARRWGGRSPGRTSGSARPLPPNIPLSGIA